MGKRYRGSISVSVDVADVFDELTDEDLKDEIEDRGLSDELGYGRDYVERGLEELLRGRYGAAIALLDRALYPTRATAKAYEQALLGARSAGESPVG